MTTQYLRALVGTLPHGHSSSISNLLRGITILFNAYPAVEELRSPSSASVDPTLPSAVLDFCPPETPTRAHIHLTCPTNFDGRTVTPSQADSGWQQATHYILICSWANTTEQSTNSPLAHRPINCSQTDSNGIPPPLWPL